MDRKQPGTAPQNELASRVLAKQGCFLNRWVVSS